MLFNLKSSLLVLVALMGATQSAPLPATSSSIRKRQSYGVGNGNDIGGLSGLGGFSGFGGYGLNSFDNGRDYGRQITNDIRTQYDDTVAAINQRLDGGIRSGCISGSSATGGSHQEDCIPSISITQDQATQSRSRARSP